MKGILDSNHQDLQDTPRRVFDILLFMQNRSDRKRLLTFDVGPGIAVAATSTPA